MAEDSGSADVRVAAAKALEGDAATVSAFLTTGQYEAMKQDMRLYIARTIANAGPIEQQAGRTALNTDTTDALRQFITTDDPLARTQDERVRAAQLADTNNKNNGPQVRAAARIALEGPSDLLHAFITVGQYKAQRQDQLGATHEQQIQQLIAQAAGIASTAQKNAAEAGRAAANAAKAAAEAEGYRRQAEAAANDAKKYATQANNYATQAEQSAKDAAASAKTARQANAKAQQAATRAINSAAAAQSSADGARMSADEAWTSANQARASAVAAGKDSAAANQAYKDAFASAVTKQREEEAEYRKTEEAWSHAPDPGDESDGGIGDWVPDWLKDTANTGDRFFQLYDDAQNTGHNDHGAYQPPPLPYSMGEAGTWKHAVAMTAGYYTGGSRGGTRHMDLIVRWDDGEVTLYQGADGNDPTHPFAAEYRLAPRKSIWANAVSISSVNATGGGTDGLVVRWSDGEMTQYTTVDAKGFHAEKQLAPRNTLAWKNDARLLVAGRFTAGGHQDDLLAVWKDGHVSLFSDLAANGLSKQTQIVAKNTTTWPYAGQLTTGSFTGNATDDLLVCWVDGETALYPGLTGKALPGEDQIRPRNSEWKDAAVVAAGAFTANTAANDDLVRWNDGHVSLFPGVDTKGLHDEVPLVPVG